MKNISSLLNLLLFFKNVFLGLIVSMCPHFKEMILSRFRRFNSATFPVTANRIVGKIGLCGWRWQLG